MKRFTTVKAVHLCNLPQGLVDVLSRAVEGELVIAGPDYDPDVTGSVWLMEDADTDAEIVAAFGAPLSALPFERVRHNPDNWFLCHIVRNNSRCDTLVIPDSDCLAEGWRAVLISQL
jgi:hypothetical protein